MRDTPVIFMTVLVPNPFRISPLCFKTHEYNYDINGLITSSPKRESVFLTSTVKMPAGGLFSLSRVNLSASGVIHRWRAWSMEHENINDWDLLSRDDRKHEAFAILFDRHKDYVYRLAVGFTGSSQLADEITQEVFVRLFEGRKPWQPRAKFTTWVYRVTLNTSRELLRKARRDRTALDTLRREMPVVAAGSPEDESEPDLTAVLAMLPDRQREALVLRFYEKLSIKTCAKVMGCREGTVKSHLHKAMANLRQQLSTTE